jgi:hypothetical protein
MSKKKQIKDLYLSAAVQVTGLSVSGSSANISAAIGTALSTAGDGGTSVPTQALGGSNKVGVIVATPHNRCEIADNTTGEKFASETDAEVYGRLTAAGAVYTLSFYTSEAGVETAYNFAAATTIKIEFNYRFHVAKLPADALIATRSRNIADDPAVTGDGQKFTEALTVTALNVLSDLAKTPTDPDDVTLTVEDLTYKSVGTAPAFSIVGKAITWNPVNAGFDLETDDETFADYFTKE